MALIETCELKKEVKDAYWKKKQSYLPLFQILMAINKCEKVDAIPVKFIEDQMAVYRNDKDFDHVDSLFDLIEAWRAEKE